MDSVKKTVVKALESYKGLQLTVSVNGILAFSHYEHFTHCWWLGFRIMMFQ